ncbi:MAG TPA: YfiR family protein [Gammaproteobacteria bacterium]
MLHTQATTRRGSSTVLRRWLHSLCASTVLLGGAGPATLEAQPATAAASSAYSEVEIKAAFLYNFGSYVQWPWEADASDPITFAVLGAAGVEQALERLVEGRTLQNRPVRVRRLRSIDELDGDDVLFIGPAENWRLAQLIAAVDGPTLIVTDAPDGLEAGSMINFQLVDRRVRFEVGLPAAESAGLVLSARLLAAALRVETTRCGLECRGGADARPALSALERAGSRGRITAPRLAANARPACRDRTDRRAGPDSGRPCA